LAVVMLLLVASAGCKRYEVRRLTYYESADRPRDRDVPMYSGDGPHKGIEIAVVQSRRAGDRSERNLQRQYDDLRRAALDLNADAIVQIEMLPARRAGFMRDPLTPFPAPKMGEWKEYVLQGSAVVYPVKELALKPVPEADATLAPVEAPVAEVAAPADAAPAAVEPAAVEANQ